MNVVQARPYLVDRDHTIAAFYALHAPLSARSSRETTQLGLMMRAKKIVVEWRPRERYGGTPGLVYCRECKLGASIARGIVATITCPHGEWGRGPDHRLRGLQRLGATNAACDFCGRVYDGGTWTMQPEHPRFIDTLHFCGPNCLDRAHRQPLLTI